MFSFLYNFRWFPLRLHGNFIFKILIRNGLKSLNLKSSLLESCCIESVPASFFNECNHFESALCSLILFSFRLCYNRRLGSLFFSNLRQTPDLLLLTPFAHGGTDFIPFYVSYCLFAFLRFSVAQGKIYKYGIEGRQALIIIAAIIRASDSLGAAQNKQYL